MAAPNDGFYTYQLKLFKEMGILTSLFIDPQNPDDFIAGFVEAVNQRQVLLRSISPFGRYDGFILVRLCDVDLILGEDDYSMRLGRLLAARGEQPEGSIEIEEGEDFVHALCRKALAENQVITLWFTDNAEHVGRVLQLDDMRVTIGEVDYFGQNPQPMTIALRDVEMASIGSEDDLLYQTLMDSPVPFPAQ